MTLAVCWNTVIVVVSPRLHRLISSDFRTSSDSIGVQGLPIVDYGRGLRTRTPGSLEVLHSLYIEGQEPAQRIILSSNSTLFSAAHTITHILVISSRCFAFEEDTAQDGCLVTRREKIYPKKATLMRIAKQRF